MMISLMFYNVSGGENLWESDFPLKTRNQEIPTCHDFHFLTFYDFHISIFSYIQLFEHHYIFHLTVQ